MKKHFNNSCVICRTSHSIVKKYLFPYSTFLFIFLMLMLSEKSFSSDTDAVKYFPLKPGNVWVYQTYSSPPPILGSKRKMYVLGDSLINGIKYYKVVNFPWYNGSPPFQLFRVDTTNGNVLHYTTPGCMVIDSLAADAGNTFSYCGNPAARKCYSVQNITMFGILRTVKEFEWTQVLSAAQRKYAKNIGIISSFYGDIFYNGFSLIGCVIDGIVYGDTNITGIKPINGNIPSEFKLHQNYPNPFNPATKIKFDIPEFVNRNSQISIRIFNSLGQHIETLINESLSPGTYEISFDGSNYPGGVYFYKLITNDFTETKRMVLLK